MADGTGQTGETGIYAGSNNHAALLLANRVTNCATGINGNSTISIFGWNLFHNNTNDTTSATYLEAIPLDSDTDTNEYDPDADDGYEDAANKDFNLKTSRTYNGDGTDTVGLGIGS